MTACARDERGSMLPFLGGLIVVALVVLGLAVDVARLHGAYVEVGLLADLASETGAAMIDEGEALNSRLLLDAERSVEAAGSVIGNGADRIEAVVDGDSICVRVIRQHRTVALGVVGMSTVDVAVRSCAEPVAG